MTTPTDNKLNVRVAIAANRVLERDKSVGPLELLQELNFLSPSHVKQWSIGHPAFTHLQPHIQCGPKKLETTFGCFEEWVRAHKLEPFSAAYDRRTREGVTELQISVDGDEALEKFYRIHFRQPGLSEAKKQRIESKRNKAPDLLVYEISSSGKHDDCAECSANIAGGDLVYLENKQPLCLECADLAHLEFLPRGNATLTRRAKKHSPLSAIVVRWNQRRKRYERQGLLVTRQAIDDAEQQSLADEDVRALQRERAAERRTQQDERLCQEMTQLIVAQFPGCSPQEAGDIAWHTTRRSSGRVGRSAAGRELQSEAIRLAVRAWIRHQHTDYDKLLMQGVERQEARRQIATRLEQVLDGWSKRLA